MGSIRPKPARCYRMRTVPQDGNPVEVISTLEFSGVPSGASAAVICHAIWFPCAIYHIIGPAKTIPEYISPRFKLVVNLWQSNSFKKGFLFLFPHLKILVVYVLLDFFPDCY